MPMKMAAAFMVRLLLRRLLASYSYVLIRLKRGVLA
jgi:hypothetical protein